MRPSLIATRNELTGMRNHVTILAIGSDREPSHPVANGESLRLAFQVV